MAINVNNIHSEILKQLKQYTKEVEENIEMAKNTTSKDLVKELKRTSPEKTGSYKTGWRIKKGFKNIIHNKTDYQLTHLLEHGHAKKGGGRVESKVHIRPAEEKAVKSFIKKVEEAIKP